MDNISLQTDNKIKKNIGQKIKRNRLRQNITQESLAKAACISTATVKRLETKGTCSFDTLLRVLRTLGLLELLSQLVSDDELSPSEYYDIMQTTQKTQRKRAVNKITPKTKEESEW